MSANLDEDRRAVVEFLLKRHLGFPLQQVVTLVPVDECVDAGFDRRLWSVPNRLEQ